MRVLLVKTSSMGDLVHTHSALVEALRACPQIRVDWVCEEAFIDIPCLSSAVDQVIPVAMRRWRRNWRSLSTYREIAAFSRRLRARPYDVVIDAQGLLKSAWITSLARCPSGRRVGFDWSSSRESLASLSCQQRVRAPTQWHAIERLRALFSDALGYSRQGTACWMPTDALRSLPQPATSPPRPAVFFLHGTSRAEKSWSPQAWIEVGRELIARGFQIVLPWGSSDEHDSAIHIARCLGPSAHVLTPTRLGELAAMLLQSEGAIGVDSGLMHLSVLLGKPTVAVMPAAANPRYSADRFGPAWAPHARVVPASAVRADIDAAAVLAAWDEVNQLPHAREA
jgi:heptosyltransferase-1